MVDERKSAVIQALVDEYIRTGEPVSSRAVLERSGLSVSPATIRNDLAALEKDGYAVQPHTSAGRIPTAAAYRFYVDHVSPARLRIQTRGRIHTFFAEMHVELGRLLKETSHLLADVSHYPAVIIGPMMGRDVVRAVHLIPVVGPVVLTVVITDQGRVTQEPVRLREAIPPEDLERAEQQLRRVLIGHALAEAEDQVGELRDDLPDPVVELLNTVAEAALRAEAIARNVYVGGTSQLASLWADLASLHHILEVLEKEAELAALLDGPIGETSVQIGSEIPVSGSTDLAVISTPYLIDGRAEGRLGVIGPMRMNYRRAISVVEEISDGLTGNLGG